MYSQNSNILATKNGPKMAQNGFGFSMWCKSSTSVWVVILLGALQVMYHRKRNTKQFSYAKKNCNIFP